MKSLLATMRPRSSGMKATPESMTAMPTPAPVTPAAPSAASPPCTWSAPVDCSDVAICAVTSWLPDSVSTCGSFATACNW
ncbi:hypothetical protein D3C83_78200 [compost metagenome]